MANNHREELIPVVLFKGTVLREYVTIQDGNRNIVFTTKFKEATVFEQWQADLKAINFPSTRLKKLPLTDNEKQVEVDIDKVKVVRQVRARARVSQISIETGIPAARLYKILKETTLPNQYDYELLKKFNDQP